jgi:hypothetical protein
MTFWRGVLAAPGERRPAGLAGRFAESWQAGTSASSVESFPPSRITGGLVSIAAQQELRPSGVFVDLWLQLARTGSLLINLLQFSHL